MFAFVSLLSLLSLLAVFVFAVDLDVDFVFFLLMLLLSLAIAAAAAAAGGGGDCCCRRHPCYRFSSGFLGRTRRIEPGPAGAGKKGIIHAFELLILISHQTQHLPKQEDLQLAKLAFMIL